MACPVGPFQRKMLTNCLCLTIFANFFAYVIVDYVRFHLFAVGGIRLIRGYFVISLDRTQEAPASILAKLRLTHAGWYLDL